MHEKNTIIYRETGIIFLNTVIKFLVIPPSTNVQYVENNVFFEPYF